MPDKIEAVKKVAETFSKEAMSPAEEMQKNAANREHFQSLVNSTQPVDTSAFERIDQRIPPVEEGQGIEAKPIIPEEGTSSQKSGTATDEERKRRQQGSEEVEGVTATGSKKSAQSTSLEETGKISAKDSSTDVSSESIKSQAKDLVDQIEQVKTKLNQPQTSIKSSYQTLLRNRLTHIDDNLKIAVSKVGGEYTPPPPLSGDKGGNPVRKVLDYLTHSQHQLENISQTVMQLDVTGAKLSPANMLAIQMKMGYVQQQIELFTNLLSKALESTKTIMNVQV